MHGGINGFDMPAPDDVRRASDALRMLADPTRLNILWALTQGETSVACLAELAATSPTAVSQHLSKLRLAGLVSNRREGNFIFYALADEHIGELVTQALSHADHFGGHRTHSHARGYRAGHQAAVTDEPTTGRRLADEASTAVHRPGEPLVG